MVFVDKEKKKKKKIFIYRPVFRVAAQLKSKKKVNRQEVTTLKFNLTVCSAGTEHGNYYPVFILDIS